MNRTRMLVAALALASMAFAASVPSTARAASGEVSWYQPNVDGTCVYAYHEFYWNNDPNRPYVSSADTPTYSGSCISQQQLPQSGVYSSGPTTEVVYYNILLNNGQEIYPRFQESSDGTWYQYQ